MTGYEFLNRVIGRGIEAAKRDYKGDKLKGAIRGFEECRGKDSVALAALLKQANEDTRKAHRERRADFWYWRCREAEVEWVCNVLSAVMHVNGRKTIVNPTARALMLAHEIMNSEGKMEVWDEEEIDVAVVAADGGM